jgi:carboxyl-terminal processing protease
MGIFKPQKLALIGLSVLCLVILPLSANAFNNSKQSTPLSPDKELALINTEILSALKSAHYKDLKIDDAFSSKLLDAYIKELDQTKNYLLASDISDFQQYQYELDDALNKADLAPAFMIFNRYQQRAEERLNWLLNQLDKGIDKVDFSITESHDFANENAVWSSNQAALNNLWRKQLKANMLDLRLAGKAENEIQEVLEKRFQHQLKRLRKTNSNDAFELYMNIVTHSYDPHTQYFAPHQSENFNISMSRSLEGIGAILQYDQEYTKVVRLVAGGPADNAGQLQPADRITGVAQGPDGEMVNVIGWRLDEVVKLIRGPKDSTVRLQIIPSSTASNQPAKEISIVRNRVELEDQKAKKEIIEVPNTQPPGTQGSRRIGIINIPDFYMDFDAYQQGDPNYVSTTRDVKQLLEELKQEKVDGVIIDLRNNGGGSLPEVNSLVGLFIDKGVTVQIKERNGRVTPLADRQSGATYNGPLAVMVNRLSASASEIFAGAIQDYQRGIVLGSQTFGKGTVQVLIPLRQGQLKITRSKFYRISGQTTQHKGVHPDIKLPGLVDASEIGEDALENALPWDTIRPVLHRKTGQITPYLAQLTSRHTERVKTNPDYQYRLGQIARVKQDRQQTLVSLNQQQRQQQRDEFDHWQLQLENTRREAKGLTPIKLLSELDEEQEAKKDQTPASDDPYLVESAHILADFIALIKQQLAHY